MDLKRFIVPTVFCLAGTLLLLYGVWLMYEPAALIVGGALLLATGLLPDWGA